MRREHPSTSSKAAKKRYRLKKRVKRRLLKEKLSSMCANEGLADAGVTATATATTTTNTTKRKNVKPNKIHSEQLFAKQDPQQQKQQAQPTTQAQMELWQKTYQTLVRWQLDQQTSYWRQRAEQLEIENAKLKRKLESLQIPIESDEEYLTSSEDEVSEQYETSSEEEETCEHAAEQDEEIHPGYLEFIKLTHKHWAERDAARAAQQKEGQHSKDAPTVDASTVDAPTVDAISPVQD